MGKASNQEDGVIACTWAFLSASWHPVHHVEWWQNMPMAWAMLVMEKWLAEAFFFFFC